MLTKGSPVLVREEGKRRNIEDISIGDFVFDPLANEYCEIVDILAREVAFSTGYDHPLYPVKLEKDSIRPGRPDRTVWVSQSQQIYYVPRQKSQTTIPELLRDEACIVARCFRNNDAQRKFSSVWYYALFTETKQTLDVAGVLMSTYSTDVYQKTVSGETLLRGSDLKRIYPFPLGSMRRA